MPNVKKTVIDVGQCGVDHGSIKSVVEKLGGAVLRAHSTQEALAHLSETEVSLVLVNRVFDRDGTSGLDAIRTFLEKYPAVPVMLVSNYPDYQQQAVALGALKGFGKQAVHHSTTAQLLESALNRS